MDQTRQRGGQGRMTFPSHHSSVPPFHSLGNGTVEQMLNQRNSPRNMGGTNSLKALANKVLEWNRKWNKPGTAALKPVPPMPQSSSACGTNSKVGYKVEPDNFLYEFNERAAIMEYDGGLTREKTEKIKTTAEKETSTDKTDKFEMDANMSVLSVPTVGPFDKESLLYEFEERIAIAEVDGNQTPIEAHRIAYLDSFMAVLATLPYENVEDDWVEKRIKATKEWPFGSGDRTAKIGNSSKIKVL